MCLVAFAIDRSRRFPLVVASNRDEFFGRATARLAWWQAQPDAPAVLGGRDLESGGTWLGLTAEGRLAMLTNVRSPARQDPQAPTRGKIVTDWLAARESNGDFWTRTALSGYNGFNLVAADFARGECFWASSRHTLPRRLERGLYGLSNGELDSPWPKVEALKSGLRSALAADLPLDALAAALFALLADRTVAPDVTLPKTGIAIERERQLSPAFIQTADQTYGTRCSTLVITEQTGRSTTTHVLERSFDAHGTPAVLRRSVLPGWPPKHVQGKSRAAVEQAAVSESEPGSEIQSWRVISTCAMPASSNTGPDGAKPARA